MMIRCAIALATLLMTFGIAATAAAETKLYDWPSEEAPAAVVTDQGIVLLHKDGAPYRVWSAKKQSIQVADIDKDGKPEIVGLGSPSFALSAGGDALWIQKKGCKEALLADFALDDKLDLVCSDGRTLRAYTHDNQEIWSMSIGRALKSCRAGDTNGDLKADIECKSGRSIVRVDGGGDLITAEGDDSLIAEGVEPLEPWPEAGMNGTGKNARFDADGDKRAEEYLEQDGAMLLVRSRAEPKKPTILAELNGELRGAFAKPLTAGARPTVVAVTDSELIVATPDAKSVRRFPLSPKPYKRRPVAELQSVYANNFVDDAAAKAAVEAASEELASCYAAPIKKGDFPSSGRMVLRVLADQEGKVSSIEQMHSEIADKKVVSCTQKELRSIDLPKAAPDGEAAVSVTILYSFRDAPKS